MTKKKKIILIITVVIIVIAVTGASAFAYAQNIAEKNSIGIDNAVDAALTDAGVNEADATVTKAKLDFENGIFVYDIEFTAYAVNEYDYTIKAADGSVIDKDCDIDESLTVASSVAETYIQQTDVAETSQAEQTEASTVAVTDEQIDTTVAETSITATTAADTSSKYIGVDKAKSIALGDVGLSASDVTFIKAKLERDDGVYEYEIEFIYGDLEYEFEINASTGKIISYDCENIYDD